MDIIISNNSYDAIYEQIYEQIAAQILKGTLAADFCLPSIRTLSRELGVSVITVNKAYEMLEQGNLIYTRAGKGCFVRVHAKGNLEDKKLDLAKERLKKDLQYYASLNIDYDELIKLIKELY